MSKFEESNFYKALQDFFINADKKTFLQFLAEFYNRTEGIIDKDNIQDDLIKELRELYIKFNEEGIDENIVREKVNYFLENSVKIQNIISKLDKNTNNIKNITSQLDNIATQTNVLNDALITSLKNNGKVLLTSSVESSTPLTLINNDLTIDGKGYSIKTTTEGQNFIFIFENCNNLEIKNIKFNSNLKGRSVLKFLNCNNVKVHNCSFTGYTLEYGYYKTDSAILIENCKNVSIDCCIFNEYGYNLSNSLEELVRCITIQGNCNNIKIKGNTFDKINQGIVCTSGTIFIENNYFDNVKDIASCITPVPGGCGLLTTSTLMFNVVRLTYLMHPEIE